MAARKKPKAKSKLHTWAVNIDGAVHQIEAEEAAIGTAGSLAFTVGLHIVQAVAAGHWATVELLEPDQD